MEYKSLQMQTKSIEGRKVTGIFAVHGNRDDYDDVSYPGSFTKTIAERGQRVKFLWNHNMFGGPPVAKVLSLREVTRDELPESVLALAPEATGGVEVVREYLKSPSADEVFQAVQEGAVDEMSYGYDAVKFSFMEIDGVRVRQLQEVRLWEVSDVIFGANPATVGSKFLVPLDMLVKQFEAYQASIKAGARHSANDVKLLNAIHRAAVDLGASQCKGIVEEETEEDPTDDEEKSRADLSGKSLTLLRSELVELELSLIGY